MIKDHLFSSYPDETLIYLAGIINPSNENIEEVKPVLREAKDGLTEIYRREPKADEITALLGVPWIQVNALREQARTATVSTASR